MTVGERLARFFVAPAEEAVGEELRWLPPGALGPPARPPARTASLAVVCSARDARLAGGAAGLALARHTGAPAVLVLEWTGCPPAAGPAAPAAPVARRLAARHGAVASGRLARLALDADEALASAQALEVLTAADAPAVLVAAGARGEAMEQLVAVQDRTLLVARGSDEVAGLAARRLSAAVVALPSSPGAAALARAGVGLVAPLRAPFLEAIGG